MLRRRFSRESRSSNDHRESGKLAFPFSLKSMSTPKPGTELTAIQDIGSSLMSERGYDSDARNLSTPTRANPMDPTGDSPGARGFRRMELSDLVERSQERDESERWARDQSQNNPNARHSPFGMHYIPTPKSSMRRSRSPIREVSSYRSARADDRVGGENGMQMGFARSLPNLNASSQESGLPLSKHSPALGGLEGANNSNSTVHWDPYLERGQKNGLASLGSVPNLSTDVLVSKKRQTTTSGVSVTDPQTLNLSDFGISHRLASQTMSSGSMSFNLSSPDLVRNNRYDPFMSSSQENLQPCQRPPQGMSRLRDPSSFYSQPGSHPSSRNTSPRARSPERPMPANQAIKEKVRGEVPAVDNGFVHESRFHEHCDAVNSPSHHQGQPYDPNEPVPPRKVSAGWMSGGRRVGYGYSPVVGPEEAENQCADDSANSKQALHRKPCAVMADANTKNERDPQSQRFRMGRQETVETAVQEPHPIPPPMNPKRHASDAVTVPRTRTSPRATNDYHMPPYLRASMESQANGSSRDYEIGAVWVDEIGTLDFRTPDVSPTTPNEQSKIPQSSHYSTYPNDASASRWAHLGRSMVQPQSRKNGEHFVGHETGTDCDPRSAMGQSVGNLGDTAEGPSEHFATEHHAEHHREVKDQAGQMHTNSSRTARWLPRLSKCRANRRLSTIHQQEASQASSAAFLERDSTDSTKSSMTGDSASAYQECLRMPGSFDGSRWANRGSRVLWDMCTVEDD